MHAKNGGFTLIELSIVLVIIGLIVGGVLVGRDLIKGAEIRATISQVEKFNAAVYTFRGKYNGMPGDLEASKAAQFGMTVRSGAGAHGDGNGQLEACTPGGTPNAVGCETILFWNDLSYASLVAGTYNTATDALVPGTTSSAVIDQYFPTVKLGGGARFTVFYSGPTSHFGTGTNIIGGNYFAILNITEIFNPGIYVTDPALNADEARQIDTKIDDGNPMTGRVNPLSAHTSNLASGEGIGDIPMTDNGTCITNGIYQSDPSRMNKRCNMTIHADF